MKRSNCDIEERWQGICVTYEMLGRPLPRAVRFIRATIERLLRAAERISRHA